jgi:predicted nuclease with TOPRIM domain
MPTVEELENALQALKSEVAGLKKNLECLEGQYKDMKQKVQNVHAELFLDEAMAQGPDKVVRMRTTIKGVVKKLAQVVAQASQNKH